MHGYQPICRPSAPPPPPCRTVKAGWFGEYETKESIRAREDYQLYMQGWRDGFDSAKGNQSKPPQEE